MSASKSIAPPELATRRDDFEGSAEDRLRRLEARVAREHSARREAERILESKSLELFAANQRLLQLNSELEERVARRTEELDLARRSALQLVDNDHLTKIASRFRFSRTLTESLDRTLQSGGRVGLLLIDIDDFKLVNDCYGHGHGDLLLKEIASRLRSIVRRRELVARLGGDEFAVILEGSAAASLEKAARRFQAAFVEPVTVGGVTLKIAGSMGLATSPEDATTSADLQRFADLALYQVKARGGGGFAQFEQKLVDSYERRRRLEAEFRGAVANDAIHLWYQPIVEIRTGETIGVEALARWQDSRHDAVGPDFFIPLAEQCGLIREVGRHLLGKALAAAKPWLDGGLIRKLTFNISPLELLDDGFADEILESLATAGVEPARLALEITEGVLIKNLGLAKTVMARLRSAGVKFALDDFGCGYTNLSALTNLPISILKIDRTLLKNVEHDESARVIISNVVNLCRDLGIRSVCEGAETAAQLTFLDLIGCNSVQGYVCARPASAKDTEAFLRNALRRRDPRLRNRGPSSAVA
ncbi:MAG TPA: EAL domain-containing protein [Sphingomicrobium sp.]|nr:EAL domain-containing protein [Sphingomicrobium sp.]